MANFMESRYFKSVVFTLIMAMLVWVFSPAATFAKADDVVSNETEAMQLLNYIEKDSDSGKVFFDAERALKEGVMPEHVVQLESNFNELNVSQQGILYNYKNGGYTTQGLLAIVVAFLAGVVAGWVLEKLIEYGVSKFCKLHKNYNKYTKKACEIFN